MTNEVVQREEQSQPPASDAFQRRQPLAMGSNVGAIAIESERAIAEAQGQLILAKRFPRDLNVAYAELMESCKIKAFAEKAFYSVPRGRDDDGNAKKVTGPSIRMAEEIARCYGNFDFGHRELSRSDVKSEVEVFAWDKEKNNRSVRQVTVMHVMDTKYGPRKLRDQKDVDDKIANVASKQVRSRILALVPKWMQAAAEEECKKTIAGTNDKPIAQRVRDMTQAFAPYGVSVDHLETYLKHSLDHTTLDELVELLGVYNALREGEKPSAYFSSPEDGQDSESPSAAAALPQAGQQGEQQAAAAAAVATATRTRSKSKPKEEPKEEPQKPADPPPVQPAAESAPPADLPPTTNPKAESGKFF